MEEKHILKIISELGKKLPKFVDGRVDYSNSITAPVVIVFVKYKDKILLLKRSKEVATYQEKWSTVAGYLDELKPIKKKVLEELEQEVGIKKDIISKIEFGQSYKFRDDNLNKLWLRFPVLVELKEKPDVLLNWEHSQFKWILPKEISDFDTPPFFHVSWEMVKNYA